MTPRAVLGTAICSDSLNLEQANPMSVFLGGDCGPTNWREEKAIPFLEDIGLTYYNPKVKKWSQELVAVETTAKEAADVLLFVITADCRGITSMLEVAEYSMTEKKIAVVIESIPDDAYIGNIKIELTELTVLNEARRHLKCILERHQRKCFNTIENALKSIVSPNPLQTKKINHIKPESVNEAEAVFCHIKADINPIIDMLKAIEYCMTGRRVIAEFDESKGGIAFQEPFLHNFRKSRVYFKDILERHNCQVVGDLF